MEMERTQLAERASGKMARMIGRVLPGESQKELDHIARKDQLRAQAGLVELKSGDKVWYKFMEDLTREDMWARIASERMWLAWLKGRLGKA
jgi:hypothetical protein